MAVITAVIDDALVVHFLLLMAICYSVLLCSMLHDWTD